MLWGCARNAGFTCSYLLRGNKKKKISDLHWPSCILCCCDHRVICSRLCRSVYHILTYVPLLQQRGWKSPESAIFTPLSCNTESESGMFLICIVKNLPLPAKGTRWLLSQHSKTGKIFSFILQHKHKWQFNPCRCGDIVFWICALKEKRNS